MASYPSPYERRMKMEKTLGEKLDILCDQNTPDLTDEELAEARSWALDILDFAKYKADACRQLIEDRKDQKIKDLESKLGE